MPIRFTHVLRTLLASGETVRFTAPGHSMRPTIRNGDVLVVEPLRAPARIGDILLYVTCGRPVAHRLIALEHENDSGGMILKGDAVDQPDLPVRPEQVVGRVAAIERRGRRVNPYGARSLAVIRLHDVGASIWAFTRTTLQRRPCALESKIKM